MKRLSMILAAITLAASASPAAAWFPHGASGGGGSSSPLVTPGATQPAVSTPDASTLSITNVSYTAPTTTHYGSSGDTGYNSRGFMIWDALQLSEIGTPGVNTTFHIGLFANHTPTDVEKAAGLDSNVASIDIVCDGGATATITAPSANPDSGQTDWNFQIQTASWADGLHYCTANGKPATGPNMAMQGPIRDEWNNGYDRALATTATIDDGTKTNVAGQILTITDNGTGTNIYNWHGGSTSGGVISYGQSVTMKGVSPNTFIDGTSQTNPTSCVAATGSNCTGSGDAGTYHVSVSQSTHGAVFTGTVSTVGGVGVLNVTSVTSGVITYPFLFGTGVTAGTHITANSTDGSTACGGSACTGRGGTGTYALSAALGTLSSRTFTTSTTATMGSQVGFWFVTNYNGTCNTTFCRPKIYVNASTGSDSNAGTSSASPVQTLGAALTKVTALDPRSNQKGVFGAVVCLMGGHDSAPSGTVGAAPEAKVGYVSYISADQAPCSVAGDPGGAGMQWTGSPATDSDYLPTHSLFQYVNFTGTGSPATGSQDAWYLAAEHVTQKSTKVGFGGLISQYAVWCSESTGWFGADGGCSGAEMNRGNSLKYAVDADGMHNVVAAVGNTVDGVGTTMMWVRGTMGTNNVITFSILPSELSGYTLAQILDTGAYYNATTNADGNYCFNGGSPGVNLSVSGNTVTFTGSTGLSGNCTNGSTVYLYFDGGHTDNFQLAGNFPVAGDVYVANNSFNATYKSGGQGLFLETTEMSGVYLSGNAFNLASSASLLTENGANELLTFHANTFGGSGSFHLDENGATYGETLIQDQCTTGTYPMFTGTSGNRRLAAGSNACYASTTP